MHTLIYNGSYVEEHRTTHSPLNRGLMYGDGCFDTLRTYRGKLFFPEKHFQRLVQAMDHLRLERPFDKNVFIDYMRKGIPGDEDSQTDWIIRTQCWRKGGRGYATAQTGCDWLMSFSPLNSDSNAPVTLSETDVRAIPEAALTRRFKLSNGLNYILAAQTAIDKQTDDVVMLTTEGSVSETTIANLFWIKERVIFTPSTDCDCYPGITRELIMDTALRNGMTVEEGKFPLFDLHQAEAAFVSNSAVGIRPVASLSETFYRTDHPILLELGKYFDQFLEGNLT